MSTESLIPLPPPPRTILRLGNFIIDPTVITAAHLTHDGDGIVVHHGGCAHIEKACDAAQALEWLDALWALRAAPPDQVIRCVHPVPT